MGPWVWVMRSKLTIIEREDMGGDPLPVPDGLPVYEEDGQYIVEFVPKKYEELHDYWHWNGIILDKWQVEDGPPLFQPPSSSA